MLLTAILLNSIDSISLSIDVTAVTNPNTASTIAANLNGSGTAISINSASFQFDAAGGGTAASELRSIGTFANGNAAGPFPGINQLNGTPATFAGGIGINTGVCLCTGVVTNADVDGALAATGSGVGIQGPNNGFPLTEHFNQSTIANAGEISFRTNQPRDNDFVTKVKSVAPATEGDATVLQFQITVSQPGFLRISFVFASDEHRFHIAEGPFDANDSMAIFVRHDDHSNPSFENIALLKKPETAPGPMSLRELRNCGAIMFRDNQIAPAPSDDLIPMATGNFPTSPHGFDTNLDGFNLPSDGKPYYNHRIWWVFQETDARDAVSASARRTLHKNRRSRCV
jgi:hypothetical protein